VPLIWDYKRARKQAGKGNSQPDLDAYTYLIERQLKPEARKDVRTLLHALEIKPTAMIDISDGSSEIMHSGL
jgi:thiamine-monophosphate kinase